VLHGFDLDSVQVAVLDLLPPSSVGGRRFRAWIEQRPITTRAAGDGVAMGNLTSRKVAGVREATESAGDELRYLPRYPPDFNPIELASSKLKTLLRDGAIEARLMSSTI